MSAPNGNVFRVHLAQPGGEVRTMDVPSEDFEASERGLILDGTTVVPWHRVVRYTRETTQEIDDAFRMHAEVRVWIDDGSEEGERVSVRADRFDPGPWTVDLLVERAVNVEAGIFHLTKIHVPWNRVLEYERMPIPVEVPTRPD